MPPLAMMPFLAARMDFGFGNPNVAGAFFSILAVSVWALRLEGRSGRTPWGFWISLFVCTLLAGMIVMTASRGSLAALAGGLLAALWAAKFPKIPVKWLIGILTSLVLLGVLSASTRMGDRLAESSLQDGSITSRLEILEKVPAMLASAPHGWGRGKAAEAYHNWFQEPDDVRTYKHLVSMHATLLVEVGWLGRWSYVFGWLVILLICFASPVAFGVWVAFGVAGLFSHVGEDWKLWALPVAAILEALFRRFQTGIWPSKRGWLVCLLSSLALVCLMVASGLASSKRVHWNGMQLTLGSTEAKVWFYRPNIGVLGRAFGKFLRDRDGIGIAWEPAALDEASPRCVVLSGVVGDLPKLTKPYDVIWLNPPVQLDDMQKAWIKNANRSAFYWGELRTDGNPRQLEAWVDELGGEWQRVSGSGFFMGEILVGSQFFDSIE